MLGNTATTSRPRPPAQMKSRTAAEGSRSTVLGSPISVALQVVAQEAQENISDRAPLGHGELLEWLKGKSHDELSELLVKADEVIKQRETDLDRTNSLCKSLYEDNTSLQSKHKALLSKLPSTPSRRPSPDSPLPSPAGSGFSPFSSHYRSSPSIDSPIRTPPPISEHDPFEFPSRSTPLKYGGRHVRKISVTPYDISLLNDQNAELLLKVEKLETESASQELTGRKMLRKLEKEINGLRSELEAVREKEALNAAKAKERADRENTDKRERKRMTKSRSGPVSARTRERDDTEAPVRDFAPPGPLSGLFNRSTTSLPTSIPDSEEPQSGSEPNTPTSASAFEDQQREFIAQVMSKMAELEETNARLQSQQAETAAQLMAVQKETDSLGRVYEGLESFTGPSGEEFEFVEEDSSSQQQEREGVQGEARLKPSDSTIRFRSFRRTLEGLPSNLPADSSGRFNSDSSHLTHKSRKSVLGLFEEPVSPPSATPVRRITPVPDGRASPALSALSGFGSGLGPLDETPAIGRSFVPTDSLSSELGLGAVNLASDGPSDHLRTSSLYDFSSLNDAAPSPSPSPVDLNKRGAWGPFELPKTPARPEGLHLTLEPPTPHSDEYEPQSPVQKQAARYRRMSQTVRARTARWVDGRFTDKVLSPGATGSVRGKRLPVRGEEEGFTGGLGSKDPESAQQLVSDSETCSGGSSKTPTAKPTPVQPAPLRLATVLDSVVEKITGRSASGSVPLDSSSEVAEESVSIPKEANNSVELYVSPTSPIQEKKPAGVGQIILELWLWLQFAVIILVFLWAMAKRGPKSVLGDRHRSASSHK
ncbi:hypothetical protein V5O48_001518 [Marasmius crinis-equi]|uniref:Uncharacterized protein n=1 Tax=Marasmius crinis-equi TaxID=585013 RepID=A0ABR3FYC6_9AGAR